MEDGLVVFGDIGSVLAQVEQSGLAMQIADTADLND